RSDRLNCARQFKLLPQLLERLHPILATFVIKVEYEQVVRANSDIAVERLAGSAGPHARDHLLVAARDQIEVLSLRKPPPPSRRPHRRVLGARLQRKDWKSVGGIAL